MRHLWFESLAILKIHWRIKDEKDDPDKDTLTSAGGWWKLLQRANNQNEARCLHRKSPKAEMKMMRNEKHKSKEGRKPST
ncbi:unnamed protein product [Acanthoscelides obtectus]|uniref:Uncharacterized protein n=1 Tax=Acanthoscelides obtectus TaxID=200917 RepID=A0A9P0QF13_ACAOB|nr:unnamed protein product [Acanthoscelides obtectus]CAK1688374.1 hypothetical protein AOBTE_LOCUS36701 [Acanthoscelides obtectus]